MLRPRLSNSIHCDSKMQEESSLWSLLPSEILERALALLPLPDVFRVRAVCKRWNALIHCAQFQEWSLRCPVAWGPFYSPRVGWKGKGSPVVPWISYDLAERKQITMPPFEFPLLNRASGWSLMAATGGLVCFRASDGGRILVCNPMTNMWKELPSWRFDLRVTIISEMIVDEQRSSYKILLAGNVAYKQPDARHGMVDLYDSITNKWTAAENLPVGRVYKCGVFCSGEFYVLTGRFSTGPYAVMILDLTTLRWRDKSIPIPEGFQSSPHIIACSGRVHLVGGIWRLPMTSIRVFQLDPNNLSRWIKVSEYFTMNEGFSWSSRTIHGCGSHGSKLYVVTYDYVMQEADMQVAVYDFATGVWEEPIVGNSFDMTDVFQTKFTFQPNLRVAP